MVDTPTTRNRLRKQELGTNTNTWGDDKLNEVIDAIDQALDGVESIALTADKVLSSTNYTVADENLNRVLKFTGTLASAVIVTIASVEHWFLVVNAAGAQVTVKTAAGLGVAVPNGATALVYCDGIDVLNGAPSVVGSAMTIARALTVAGALGVAGKITGLTAGTDATDAVNKTQMDAAIAAQLTSGDGSLANSATDTTRRFLNTAMQFFGSLVGATQDAAADEWMGVKLKADQTVPITVNGTLSIGSLNPIDTTSAAITALNTPDDGNGIDGADLEDGDLFEVWDVGGVLETNNCTLDFQTKQAVVTGNSGAPSGLIDTLVMATNGMHARGVWDESANRWLVKIWS